MDIFVGNLAPEVTEEDLQDLFELYGEVGTVRIEYDASGESRGVGLVTMADRNEALEAIDALNKTPLQGQRIKVRRSSPGFERGVGVSEKGRGEHDDPSPENDEPHDI
ncbi:MAG: RNA-binding protein [Spirochaetae bacterium HGW-Spirochaetae-1]|jgi:RNA recognition motif-containing protein|nr:MAG: RNA-binding protein [Spirochaetae bacterium HGW-Spirochaetae-1]